MDERIREIAKRLGAHIVAELPDVGHGALGAAHYASFYQRRMEEIRRHESTTSSQKDQSQPLEVPVNEATLQALDYLVDLLSTSQKKIGRTQLAEALLKGATVQVLSQAIQPAQRDRVGVEEKIVDVNGALMQAVRELCENGGVILAGAQGKEAVDKQNT